MNVQQKIQCHSQKIYRVLPYIYIYVRKRDVQRSNGDTITERLILSFKNFTKTIKEHLVCNIICRDQSVHQL
jgi:hypothetical protein